MMVNVHPLPTLSMYLYGVVMDSKSTFCRVDKQDFDFRRNSVKTESEIIKSVVDTIYDAHYERFPLS
jgi:hypothetical protein